LSFAKKDIAHTHAKPMIIMPRTRIKFELDLEEREIISNSEELSKEQIWSLLEKKRHEELARRTIIL
jgi:hypothetical protein